MRVLSSARSREIEAATSIVFATEREARAWVVQEGHVENSDIICEVAVDASFYDGEWGEVLHTEWCLDMTWTVEVPNQT